MYLINWTAKCQGKTLSRQFHAGARYFDIRVKWDEKRGKWVLAHGLIEYKGSVYEILDTLNNLAAFYGETVYVRFLLEYNKRPDNEATKILKLKRFVDEMREAAPHLTYHLIETKWDEKVIKEYSKSLTITHRYSSVLGWKRFLWIPYWYAKLHNGKALADNADIVENPDEVLMLDFV